MVNEMCSILVHVKAQYIEIFNFLKFSSIAYEIIMNLLKLLYIFKRYFKVWSEEGEDPDPWDQTI